MATIVQKYGGSSVADVAKLRQVAKAVVARRRAGDRVVVVVSAMGKTTDALIAQAREVAPEPPQRELDMLVTAGERISMALLSMAIHEEGEDAISFTGSQSGIITEPAHQGARILEVRPVRLQEELGRNRIIIVAGYQGVSTTKEVTTLGRGGSDTTAVALAAALSADACEIYSDVDGVYTGDPAVCPQARLLGELPYEVMQTMALVGAKVLSADAVEFARRAGIAIYARKTSDPSGRQTLVHANAPRPSGVAAVVSATAVTRLWGRRQEFASLGAAISDCGGRIMLLESREQLDVLVDRTGVPGQDPGRIARLAQGLALEAAAVGVVTLVGGGLAARPALWSAVASALQRVDVPVQGWFANDLALSAVIAPEACARAVRELHAALVPAV
jgi:aspartate kinase